MELTDRSDIQKGNRIGQSSDRILRERKRKGKSASSPSGAIRWLYYMSRDVRKRFCIFDRNTVYNFQIIKLVTSEREIVYIIFTCFFLNMHIEGTHDYLKVHTLEYLTNPIVLG